MNNLIVKEVNFLGDNILATQDEQGNIWAGVKWLCNGIGLSEDQMKNERKRIQSDLVLNKGQRNFVLLTNGGKQEALCLMIDYIPLWLAKVGITPKMKEDTPQVVEKLINYQLKVKDILAQAFLPQYQQLANKKTLDLKAVSVISKAPKGNMSLVLQALDKMGYDVEGLDVQPKNKVVDKDFTSIINRTMELIDDMIYKNIELSQYIAIDEENDFICMDFTRLYKELIKYIHTNDIDFDYLTEKDFKQQLKRVDYCITNRYVKRFKL